MNFLSSTKIQDMIKSRDRELFIVLTENVFLSDVEFEIIFFLCWVHFCCMKLNLISRRSFELVHTFVSAFLSIFFLQADSCELSHIAKNIKMWFSIFHNFCLLFCLNPFLMTSESFFWPAAEDGSLENLGHDILIILERNLENHTDLLQARVSKMNSFEDSSFHFCQNIFNNPSKLQQCPRKSLM